MPTVLIRLPSCNGPKKSSGPRFTDCKAGGTCLYLKEESCFYYNQSGQVQEDIKGLLEQASEIWDLSSTGVWTSPFPSWLLPFLGPVITIYQAFCLAPVYSNSLQSLSPAVPSQADVTTRVEAGFRYGTPQLRSGRERLLLRQAVLRPCTAGRSYRRKRPPPQFPRSILSMKSLRGELLGEAH